MLTSKDFHGSNSCFIYWHYWQNIINMLHDGRANGKGFGKQCGGDNEKWRKAPTHHVLSNRSATAWQFTSWINSFMVIWSGFRIVMALAAGGDCTLSDASLPFHSNCADRETSQQKHITWAQPLVMPSAHVAHAPILYWRRYREQSLRRVAGSLAVRRLRPEIKQIGHQVGHSGAMCWHTDYYRDFLDIIFIPSDN